jgi:hypothetical protein
MEKFLKFEIGYQVIIIIEAKVLQDSAPAGAAGSLRELSTDSGNGFG